MPRKLTDKQKRLKKDQEERRRKNKLEKMVVVINNKHKVEDIVHKEMDIKPNIEWLDLEYPAKKRFEIYNDFVENYKIKNQFSRDIDWENYNLRIDFSDSLRDFFIGYDGNSTFLCEIAPYVEYYRCRKYKEASIGLLKIIDKYPNEGWGYYYFARAFSCGYRLGNGEFYSLRFFKRAVELDGYLEMYLEYANMLMICGDILARSAMPRDAEKLYKYSIEVYNEAEKKYPEYGDISRMRDHVPASKKTGNSVSNLSMKHVSFDNESREWLTDNLLFPINQDLLL